MAWLKLVNALLFQFAWFGNVLIGSVAGLVAILALAGLSLHVARDEPACFRRDVQLAVMLGAVGWCLDTGWVSMGVLSYAGAQAAPMWIVLLWMSVGFTVRHSLAFLGVRPLVGGLLAGAFAPVSYLGGERLGAVAIADPWDLAWIALAWTAVFWAAFAFARRHARVGSARSSAIGATIESTSSGR